MRLNGRQIVTDHDLMLNQGPDDHHNQATSYTILVNSLSIAPGAYQYRVSVGLGFKCVETSLRGPELVDIQGAVGFWGVATDTAGQSGGESIRPYGGGYYTSYMGAYSRLHGDSYLTHAGQFGTGISLRDLWYDSATGEVVHEFYNHALVNRNLTVHGTGLVK